nr:signal peptide peptidase-like 2A isoform X2 [Nothobranchius furzeri]
MMKMKEALGVVLFSLTFLTSQINGQEAVLHISDASSYREYCVVHNHSWTPLPQLLDSALQYQLVNLTSTLLCNSSGINPDVVKGKALVAMRGECDFSQKALVAQSLGAAALLIASSKSLVTPSANDSEYTKVKIPLALMRYRDFLEAKKVFGEGMQASLYAPPYSKIDPSIAVILLISMVTITLGGFWSGACERWIWILQDLLGIAFCLNFMKTISLSNFKICVILLSLLLVYDVFFVFITPFFTKNGVSIMVQVALGPDASGEKTQGNMVEIPAEPQPPAEKLPVVMRIPRFSAWAQNLCGMQFSILGYGDIIIPGLLVAYCSRFDVWINSRKKIYFISCCIAYLLGMILTFAVMLLSGMGQPALLYLVPFTLITSVVLAGCRGEMKQFWAGTPYEVRAEKK